MRITIPFARAHPRVFAKRLRLRSDNLKIRWVQDGKTLIKFDQILLRTGARATLSFKQFAMLPYIGDGSPVAQSFWIDDLTVATAKP